MLTPDILACRALFLVDMSIGLALPNHLNHHHLLVDLYAQTNPT